MEKSDSLAYAGISSVEDNPSLRVIQHELESLPASALESDVFDVAIRPDHAGRVIVMGRPSRKHTTGFLNIPIGRNARERLDRQIVGSLAMGVSGLLEWALKELERKHIALEIQARP